MPAYFQNLEARNFVPGGNVAFSLDGLPAKNRVRNINLRFELSGTKGSTDVLNGDLFAKVVSNIKLGQFVNIPGYELQKLLWAIHGHVVEDPNVYYSITNAASTTFNMVINLDLPFRDARGPASDDGSLAVEALAGKSLELSFASSTVWSVGSIAVTAGIVRCSVEFIHETNIPQLARIEYIDASSQTMRLQPGIYSELLIMKPDQSLITPSDVATLDVKADGRPILQNMRFEQLIQAWNRSACRNQCGTGRGELSVAGAPFLPLSWRDNTGKSNATKQMYAESNVLVQITSGALTNPRFVAWRLVPKDDAAIAELSAAIGLPPGAAHYEPAVASKTQPHGVGDGKPATKKVMAINRFFPGKWRRTKTPGNKL